MDTTGVELHLPAKHREGVELYPPSQDRTRVELYLSKKDRTRLELYRPTVDSNGVELHRPAKDRTGADLYLPESTIGQYQRRSKLTRQTSSRWRRKKDTWLYGSQPIAVSTLHLLVNLSLGSDCLLCTSFLSSYPKCLSFPPHASVQHDLLFALLVLVNNFSFRCFFLSIFFGPLVICCC